MVVVIELSECEFQSVLNFTWTAITSDPAEVALAVCALVVRHGVQRMAGATRWLVRRRASIGAVRQLEVILIRTELNLVEHVEELHAELHANSLRQLEVLEGREVGICESWTSA